MPRGRWVVRLEALWWRALMEVGMVLHRLAYPRPISPSFAVAIPATVSARPGRIGLIFYTPEDYESRRCEGYRFPVVVNFHGGGFTIGRATDDARWASELVNHLDAVVVSVNYRLAPEHPFPTAVEDGVDAILFLGEQADRFSLDVQRFAISGFSAGGNLAFTVPMLLHDYLQGLSNNERIYTGDVETSAMTLESRRSMHVNILAIVAWYPPTDFTNTTAMREATCTRPSEMMPRFFVELFDEAYIYPPTSNKAHPLLSPGKASDELLRTLPHDIVICTCEWDMLRAEADAFAYRLRHSIGKNVTHTVIPHVAHAWDKTVSPFRVSKGAAEYYKVAAMKVGDLFERPLLEDI